MTRSLQDMTKDEWERADQWWDQRADRGPQAPVEGVTVSKCSRCGHYHREDRDCDGRPIEKQQSPGMLIPDWVIPGTLILAPVLERIANEYGRDVAFIVDDLSAPCEACARNTFMGGVCFECEERLDALLLNIEPAMALEKVGAYSPRCD